LQIVLARVSCLETPFFDLLGRHEICADYLEALSASAMPQMFNLEPWKKASHTATCLNENNGICPVLKTGGEKNVCSKYASWACVFRSPDLDGIPGHTTIREAERVDCYLDKKTKGNRSGILDSQSCKRDSVQCTT